MNKGHSSSVQGLSLIGVVIALFMLIMGALAVTRVAAHTERVTGGSRQSFIAANVAREGLELVRAVRDTNWRQGEPWAQQICDGAVGEVVFAIDHTGAITSVSGSAGSPLYQTRNGTWQHQSTANSAATGFNRQLIVDCTLSEPVILPDGVSLDIEADDTHIMVTSQVTWERSGETQSLELKEALYDWYQSSE